MERIMRTLARKKVIGDETASELKRVLTVLDLTALGVGSTLGLGVYVLAGAVARSDAGPAVCVSFLIAAVASAVAGLCYAEFAARVPRAGSAYVYSYVSVGEFVAYVIGWNLILEYVIGTASVARGLSNYIDSLTGKYMSQELLTVMPININFLSPYPDFFSFGIIMILAALLAFGVKESTRLNNAFTAFNLVTIAIVLVSGSIKSNVENWRIKKEDIPPGVRGGEGGFAPYGIAGIMAGAAKCFYGFVGFDCVATTGEEAKNPQRNIPVAIVLSLIIIFLAYFGVSTVLTLMWPYYDQDPDAPFSYVFDQVGLPSIKWTVAVGVVFALCTSLLGAMFPLPRILYAMANDGLLFKVLAKVHPRTQTPVIATMLSGVLAGIMATIFDLQQLIDMMSIGTLLAYTIVAICVVVLRYQQDEDVNFQTIEMKKATNLAQSIFRRIGNIFNMSMIKSPTPASSSISNFGIIVFSILAIVFCAIVIFAGSLIEECNVVVVVIFTIVTLFLIATLISLARQPVSSIKLSFKVPWVPVIPCLSVLINFYLMLELDGHTWIRFSVWMVVGFLIYFFYSLKNSHERYQTSGKKNDVGVAPMNSAPADKATPHTNGHSALSNRHSDKSVHELDEKNPTTKF